MNPVVEEWLRKAEADYRTAARENAVVVDPNCDAVCFHAQQCIEKTMKALLIHQQCQPPRIHDLRELGKLLKQACPKWSSMDEDLNFLSRSAVIFRYPGESADREDASESLEICARLRATLLPLLDSTP